MFTGIVEEVGKVISALPDTLSIAASKVLPGVELGGSIDVNGACLTVTSFGASAFSVGLMPETLRRTNIGALKAGDKVNLERPLALGGPLGGHLVQGHVDATGKVTSIRRDGEAVILRFEAPPEAMRYIVEKGYVAVDGISLTVMAKDTGSFEVSVVGYTRQHTTLGDRRIGDRVNLEIDIMAKYMEQLGQVRGQGITFDFLRNHGFLAT